MKKMYFVPVFFIVSLITFCTLFNELSANEDCFFKIANKSPNNFRFWQQRKKIDLIDCKKSCFVVEDDQQQNFDRRRSRDDCSFLTYDRCEKSCYIYRGGKINRKSINDRFLIDSKHKDVYEVKKGSDVKKCLKNLLTVKAKDNGLNLATAAYATGHCPLFYSTYFVRTQIPPNMAAKNLAAQKDAIATYSIVPSEELCLDICKNERLGEYLTNFHNFLYETHRLVAPYFTLLKSTGWPIARAAIIYTKICINMVYSVLKTPCMGYRMHYNTKDFGIYTWRPFLVSRTVFLQNPASDRRIRCSGFYFDGDSSKCTFLADGTNLLFTSNIIATRGEIFYFEKFCLKLRDNRKCEKTFNRHPQRVLIGFAAEISNTASIFDCIEKCYNSWTYYGFDCYSILYCYEKVPNCVLNTDDHENHQDLFLIEETSIVDYINLNCQKSETTIPQNNDPIIDEAKHILNNQESIYKRRL